MNFHETIKLIKIDQTAQLSRIQIKAESDLELLENLFEYTKVFFKVF